MTVQCTLIFSPANSVVEFEAETQTIYESYTQKIVIPADVTTQEQMYVVEASGSLAFWDDPEEDLYSGNDVDAV